MRSKLVTLLPLLLLTASTIAQADTIGVYAFNADVVNALGGGDPFGTFSGTIYLDETVGIFTGANFSLVPPGPGNPYTPITYTFTSAPVFVNYGGSPPQVRPVFQSDQTGSAFLTLGLLQGTGLVGYAGGNICSPTFASSCGPDEVSSTWDLLSTGSLGLVDFKGILKDGSLTRTGTIIEVYPLPYDPTQDPGSLPTGTDTATPEPSSLLLLGTGLLGAVGVARRRITD